MGTSIASVVYPVGIKVMVDAFLHHDLDGIISGAGLICVLYSLQWALSNNAATAGTTLSDRVNLYLSAHIAALLDSVGGVEHLEDPGYLKELDLLDDNRPLLANGPRQSIMVLSMVVRVLGVVVLLGLIWSPLMLLPLVTVVPVIGERLSVRVRQLSDERLAEDRRLANELFDIAAAAGPAKELRVYGLAPEIQRRRREAAQRVYNGTVRASLTGGAFAVGGWSVFALGFGAAVVEVAIRAAHGEASVGQVVLAVTLVQRAQFQVAQTASSVGQLLTMSRTAKRLFWIEDYAEEAAGAAAQVASPHLVQVPRRLSQGITLDHVTFSYPGSSVPVLVDLSAHLPAGAAVALVGANGAGKTTLVKLLTRMYKPSAGQILVDGVPLSHFEIDEWRGRVSAAFQDFLRPELYARQVVGIGDVARVEDDTAVEEAVALGGAADVVASLPDGLSASIGRSFGDGRELSGGQWQKLALARSMMRQAPLLLVLDEPTASLDAPTEKAVFDRYIGALRRAGVTAGAVTLLVSHRFSTVGLADLILVVDCGRVTEYGTHAELMARGGTYAELYELQAAAYR
jgi:ATP-binding cassette subfamily B protein